MAKSKIKKSAAIFGALGDETRLGLVQKLVSGGELSITELTEGLSISRQAVTKHLPVLQDAGLVQQEKSGREIHFSLHTKPLQEAMDLLASVEKKWEQRLMRLKMLAENLD